MGRWMAVSEQNSGLTFRSLLYDWFVDKAKEADVGINFDKLHDAVDVEISLEGRTYYCHVGRIHVDSFNGMGMHDPRLIPYCEKVFSWAVKTVRTDVAKETNWGRLYSMIRKK
jgi:hypothetical protein